MREVTAEVAPLSPGHVAASMEAVFVAAEAADFTASNRTWRRLLQATASKAKPRAPVNKTAKRLEDCRRSVEHVGLMMLLAFLARLTGEPLRLPRRLRTRHLAAPGRGAPGAA